MTVTGFAVPTLASANVAAAPPFTKATSSEPTTPNRAALLSESGAVSSPLMKARLTIETPVIVKGAAMIWADTVG